MVFSYKLPVKSNENFLIDLGLYNSFGLWGKVDRTKDLATTKADLYTEDFGRFDFGLITGIGYDTQKINYSLRVKHGYMLNGSTRDRPMAFLFTIGPKLQ